MDETYLRLLYIIMNPPSIVSMNKNGESFLKFQFWVWKWRLVSVGT